MTASTTVAAGGRKVARYMHGMSSLEERWLRLEDMGLQGQSDQIKAIYFVPMTQAHAKIPTEDEISIRVVEFGATSYWPKSVNQALQVAGLIMERSGCGLIQQRKADRTWGVTHRFAPEVGIVVEPVKAPTTSPGGEVVAEDVREADKPARSGPAMR